MRFEGLRTLGTILFVAGQGQIDFDFRAGPWELGPVWGIMVGAGAIRVVEGVV